MHPGQDTFSLRITAEIHDWRNICDTRWFHSSRIVFRITPSYFVLCLSNEICQKLRICSNDQSCHVPMVLALAHCQCTEASTSEPREVEGEWCLVRWADPPRSRSSENGVVITCSHVIEQQYSWSRAPVNGNAI